MSDDSASLPTLRHELKFVVPRVSLSSVEGWVVGSTVGFRRHFPNRHVNNVYFDTIDIERYAENLAGVSRRHKLRLRWYGALRDAGVATLEVKIRRNRLGYKKSLAISDLPALEQARWSGLLRELRGKLPDDFKIIYDGCPDPVLINRYLRRYFVSRDGLIRLTIDSDQQFADQRGRARPNLAVKRMLPEEVVVEVKFDESSRRDVDTLLRWVPFTASRNSKYINSVNQIL